MDALLEGPDRRKARGDHHSFPQFSDMDALKDALQPRGWLCQSTGHDDDENDDDQADDKTDNGIDLSAREILENSSPQA